MAGIGLRWVPTASYGKRASTSISTSRRSSTSPETPRQVAAGSMSWHVSRWALAKTLELVHVRDEGAGAHDIVEAATEFDQGAFDLGEHEDGLLVDVLANDLAVLVHCRGSGHRDKRTRPYCPAIGGLGFPARPAYVLCFIRLQRRQSASDVTMMGFTSGN